MTFLTPGIDAATRSTASSAGAVLKAGTDRVIRALVRRAEHVAQVRARRAAARMTEAELSRLPEAVRMDLGVNLPDTGRPSAFLEGLAGPSAFWGPGAGRRRSR